MNRPEVNLYFDILLGIMNDHGLRNQPRRIYNIDETGLQLNNKPEKVIATKGKRDVHQLSSAEKGETVTIIACCNAEGKYIPPYVIFKGKRKKPEFEDGLPPGSACIMSPKPAYVSSAIFLSTGLKTIFSHVKNLAQFC